MLPPSLAPTLDAAADHLRRARRVFVVTGAGISAEAGLPTYRGVGGLYDGKTTDEGHSIEEVMSGTMLRHKPHLTWKYLRAMEEAARGARPARAHFLLAALATRLDSLLVLTQNVDGLHRLAGSPDVIDIHGDLRELLCTGCGDLRPVDDFSALPPGVPACALCRGLLRPHVVLFGEQLPDAKLRRLERELERGFDLYLSVGTTSVFPYIYGPLINAARRGLPTIEINPSTTPISDVVQHRLPLRAGEALDALASRAFPDLALPS